MSIINYLKQKYTKKFWSQCGAEFLGTLFLTEIVACTISNDTTQGNASIGIGFALCVIVYALGHISGAHVNPAVTIALWIRRACDSFTAISYIFYQILGSLIGAWIGISISKSDVGIQPTVGFSDGQAIAAEIFFTYLLCTVVINVATTKANKDQYFYGFAIGTTITASGYAVGDISGGAFNPAVASGIIICTPSEYDGNIWIYWLGDCMGAILAGITWYIINYEEAGQEQKTKKQELETKQSALTKPNPNSNPNSNSNPTQEMANYENEAPR